jgi:two-component system sensor histidine kinase BarA
LTAHDTTEEASKSVAAGMNDFLTKPLTVEKGLVTLFKWVFQKKDPELNVKKIIAEKKESTTKTSAIDWQLSIDMMNGNEDAAKEMLELFVTETLPKDEKEITQAFEKRDLAELARVIHRMHGGLCYVGVPGLKEACKNLEVAAKLGEKEKIDELYSKLKIEIEEVKRGYKEGDF